MVPGSSSSRRSAVFAVAAILNIVVAIAGPGRATAAGAAQPVIHTIVIEGMRFDPETLTVKPGDTIVWINNDPFPHTATSTGGDFDSRAIATGGRWQYAASRRGVLPYGCSLHPTMKATLRVSADVP